MYSVPICEQSTTINIDRDKKECDIYTSDTTMMTKLDKLCEKAPNFYRLESTSIIDDVIVDKCYIIMDKSLISFRNGKIVLSEEQKQKRAEQMRNLRKTK